MNVSEGSTPRFSGLTGEMRTFFRSRDRDPRPDSWPGGDRVTYVKDVLGPLKAFTLDLRDRLEGVAPRLALQPRVGASLAGPGPLASDGSEVAVSTVRAWDAAATPATSPLLSVHFSGEVLRLTLESRDADAVDRLAHHLLGLDDAPRQLAATLLGRGWSVHGPIAPDASDETVPADVRPWLRRNRLEVARALAWEPWLGEPAFVDEVADRFRELAPLLPLLRSPSPAVAAVGS